MRFIYPIIVLIVLALSVLIFVSTSVYSDPSEEAVAFLQDIKEANLSRAVKRFGGNVCRCPAKGGWGSYLIYVSAQEPNLAFLVGHDFAMGKAVVHPLKRDSQPVLPWEKPEDTVVDIPLTFDQQKYTPLFLPLKMAYGHKMTEKEFDDFCSDPDKEAWKGFYLRLRPTLKPGALMPPEGSISPEAAMEFQALKDNKAKALSRDKESSAGAPRMRRPLKEENEDREEAPQHKDDGDESGKKSASDQKSEIQELKELFGEEAAAYIEPKDPGPVVREDGSEIPPADLEARCPRMKSTLMRLHVVRRGQLKDWTIYHFGTMDNVLIMPGGKELKLQHDRPPNYSEEKISPIFKDDK